MPEEIKAVDIEMIEAWREFLHALYPYLKITGELCVKNIAKTVMSKINLYVNEENAFTLNDEKTFWYYDEIMQKYAAIVSALKGSRIDEDGSRISEILNGICEILSAQLKQYEEHLGRAPGSLGKAFKNPIGSEKERVLADVYRNVSEALKIVSDNVFADNGYFERNELKEFCFGCVEKSANESHTDFFTFLYQRIIEKGGLDIYKSYSHGLTKCAASINSLDLRKETLFFYETLKQEQETLGSIVKIQVSALAEEHGLAGASGCVRHIVEKTAVSLAEAYKSLDEKVKELNDVFGEPESVVKRPVLMDYDGFLSYVEENGLCAHTDKLREEGLETGTLSAVQAWLEKLEEFSRKFSLVANEFIKTNFDPKPYKMFLYEMRKKIADKIIFTDEMLKAFKELKCYYDEYGEKLRENVPEELFRIIAGINESVTIKIDTLEDAKRAFEGDAALKLDTFSPPELTQDDENGLLARRFAAWGEEMLEIDAYSSNYAEEARNAVQAVILKLERINNTDDYSARVERKILKETDEVTKLESAYLKNSVLFEIVTFEEILTYSVSKLRACENTFAAEYAARCDALEEVLVKLCKLHNIMIIAPEPYDFFNSSEHEVLIAERNEGYKKGQIIKKMNSGFKYNEAVLVRANVIAAK